MTRKIIISTILLLVFLLPPVPTQGADFKLARAKFDVEEEHLLTDKVDAGLWDIQIIDGKDETCERLLKYLEKLTTFKVDKNVYLVDFKDLNKLTDFTFIFMHASGTLTMTKQEKDNMREYLNRGGFIFAEDCVYHKFFPMTTVATPGYKRPYRYISDLFFKSFKKMIQTDIFPGKKMELLPLDHEVYHCMYNLPNGLPYMQGVPHGGFGLNDDKGRLSVFLSSNDIHCGWNDELFSVDKNSQAVMMMANLIVYAYTH